MTKFDQVKQLLEQCSEEQRLEVFKLLRQEFPIHPLETKLKIPAEIILEAIDRSSDLTLRGVRGIITELAFNLYVIENLKGWISLPLSGNLPYDYLLQDNIGRVSVQVKMQRLRQHEPMMANEARRDLPKDMYVVETQRTRAGVDRQTGAGTRPYRFGEFDILAVSLQPSTDDWKSFMFAVATSLIPDRVDPKLLAKFQPVPAQPGGIWTNQFETCVKWFRSSATTPPPPTVPKESDS